MTNPNHTDTSRSGDLVKECRLDAKAFRENTVYDSDGDPIRLIANAERLDQYADRIEALEVLEAELTANERMVDALQIALRDAVETNTENCRQRDAAADRIEALEAALREVFEEWAGSEDFIPETAPEGYLLQLTKRMAGIARAALEKKQ